jgi:hypothetical protein
MSKSMPPSNEHLTTIKAINIFFSERTNTKKKEEEDKLSTAKYFDRDGAESLKR